MTQRAIHHRQRLQENNDAPHVDRHSPRQLAVGTAFMNSDAITDDRSTLIGMPARQMNGRCGLS